MTVSKDSSPGKDATTINPTRTNRSALSRRAKRKTTRPVTPDPLPGLVAPIGDPFRKSESCINKPNIASMKADPFYEIAARIVAFAETIDKEIDVIARDANHPLKDVAEEYGSGIYGQLRSAATAAMEAVNNGGLLYWVRPEVSPNYQGQINAKGTK